MLHNIFNKKERDSAPEMLFSQNISMSTDTCATRRNCNVLVTGATQPYRNAHYVLPNLAQPTGSYVIMDDTNEHTTIQDMTEQTFRDHGYDIKVFDIYHPESSLKYNPFAYIHEDADIPAMVNAITKNLAPACPETTKMRTALLRAICFYLHKECHKSEESLANIAKLLHKATLKDDSPDYKFAPDVLVALDILFEGLKKKDPTHIAVQEYAKFKDAPAKLAPGVLTCLLVDWSCFQLDAMKDLTSTDQLNLADLGLKPTVLYIKYSSRNTAWSCPIIPILLTQLFETLYHTAETTCARGTLPVHVRAFLNNFGAYGSILDFGQKMNTMRPYNISCDILVDNIEVLKTVYPDEWFIISVDCDTIIYLPTPNVLPEFFSKLIRNEPPAGNGAVKQIIKKCPATIKKGAEPILTASHLANLKPGDCAVFIKGCVPPCRQGLGCTFQLSHMPNLTKQGTGAPQMPPNPTSLPRNPRTSNNSSYPYKT